MHIFRHVLFVHLLRHIEQSTSITAVDRTLRVHTDRIYILQAPRPRQLDYSDHRFGHSDHHRAVDGQMAGGSVSGSSNRWTVREVFLVCLHRSRGDVRPRANRRLRCIRVQGQLNTKQILLVLRYGWVNVRVDGEKRVSRTKRMDQSERCYWPFDIIFYRIRCYMSCCFTN